MFCFNYQYFFLICTLFFWVMYLALLTCFEFLYLYYLYIKGKVLIRVNAIFNYVLARRRLRWYLVCTFRGQLRHASLANRHFLMCLIYFVFRLLFWLKIIGDKDLLPFEKKPKLWNSGIAYISLILDETKHPFALCQVKSNLIVDAILS